MGKWEKLSFGVLSEGLSDNNRGIYNIILIEDFRSRVKIFYHEARKESGISGCHYFHYACRGRRLFLSMQPDSYNMLNANPKFNMVKIANATLTYYKIQKN